MPSPSIDDSPQVIRMKPEPQKIINEAMQLEPTSRAQIAEALSESLNLGADLDISEQWREDIRRRCEEIDQSATELIPGDQVVADLHSNFR